MKIVVLDGYTENPGDLSWDGLKNLGELTVYDRTQLEDIVERIGDAEAIYVNKTPVSEAVMERCPNLRFIGVLATGYNVVDVKAAKERDIVVCNIPSYGTDAVAQYTFALLLELCHHVGEHSESVKDGAWSRCPDWCFWNYPLMELAGKVMGIIGFGRIGRRVAEIALAFGMKVIYYTQGSCETPEGERCRCVSLDELLENADVITLHCPLTPETEGMIHSGTIARMKQGVLLINDSRGPLIVEEDLSAALCSGKIGGAAVDVVSTEPICGDNPLLTAPNTVITPHIAWAPREARQRLMDIAVENLVQFCKGTPQNVINV
ncbi:D-2-hydroxyacid dehydrogenase [Lachnotalea sp. AF33-28]|jgi:glycerate dehydrogenase|uniref:D-2-hydroxyacid dehydrogenase n=1 Tax=Lachnotalea sp. AF33-28 TaxID=2292046 RepID=UPI000E4F78B9|nr:D-2-hydroxyacid dehydrogenase [Lachnotalea sp. AF33-28]RHP32067.1 D-2-hydroxyacid dehydrogenase [Lachnotalea sp. AF33-28]